MDRWEALYKFWSSFGIPAYRETDIQDIKDLTYPFITYQSSAAGWDEPLALSASIWDYGSSRANIDRISDTIERAIRIADPVAYDGGMYRVWVDSTPFAQDMDDPDNDKIKRKVLNVMFEFMQIN